MGPDLIFFKDSNDEGLLDHQLDRDDAGQLVPCMVVFQVQEVAPSTEAWVHVVKHVPCKVGLCVVPVCIKLADVTEEQKIVQGHC